MASKPFNMEARGVGATDVVLVEKIFHRIMSEGPDLLRSPADRIKNSSSNINYSSGNKSNRYPKSANSLATQHQYAGSRGLYVGPRMQHNSENRKPHQNRSAGVATKRHMALDCGLKSLPVNAKWTPAGRISSLESVDQVKLSQSQLHLQAPDGPAAYRRGLSGCKVKKSPQTPRPGSQTPRSSFVIDTNQDQSESTYPLTPSPRPQSFKFNNKFSNATPEDDDGSGLVTTYKWNSSDQSLRLQRQLSRLTSSRAMKRASEIYSHRLDPMYLMSGSKLSLQNRYGIDDEEMKRLQEMTQVRDGLMSDLKKMKFPYGARAPTHIVKTMKHRPDDSPRALGPKTKGQTSHNQSNNEAHYSSPASEPTANSTIQQERPPSVHSESDDSLRGAD